MTPEPNPPVLRFLDLHKSFGERCLFRIPELSIHPRTCLLLKGRNGAGKSTLMKILAGLEAPDGGLVESGGERRPWHAARQLCRSQAIYVHQQPYLFDRSVEANVAYGLEQAGWPRRRIRATVGEALEWAGLSHLAGRNARTLSGGEKQRVTLTRARVLQPRLLLLDEPTASMDRAARDQTQALVRRLRDEGMGILISSHELQEMTPLADLILTLEEGRLRQEDDTPPKIRAVPPHPAMATALA
ncbi:MAG: ABC transporter ATP-binding protein [Gammaproteobacteria bacterium]|nr:ABC transporter ATP-binding protein [Gammaproteobacteria bacterium]